MNKERLLALASFLKTESPKDYNIGNFKTCAIGMTKRVPEFKDLKTPERFYAARVFFGLSESQTQYLFSSASVEIIKDELGELISSCLDEEGCMVWRTDTPEETAQRIINFVNEN